MKINEYFETLQGEGKYAGHPTLFVRLADCDLDCSFCDTEWRSYKEMSVADVYKIVQDSNKEIIVWTGGEPTLQRNDLEHLVNNIRNKKHTLESNGNLPMDYSGFDYVTISPKTQKTAESIGDRLQGINHDIKIVTDLKMNKKMLPYATMLMPLTTFDPIKDKQIKQNVWNYCVKNNLKYTPRLHIELFNGKKGI